MLGTLNGALEVRQVVLEPEQISATVEGINEVVDRVPLLTELRIHYRLQIPAGSAEVVDRALKSHQSKCPSAQSFKESVRIGWTAEIDELE
jgi:organic hydroperoxide reductase OsmC/OhrA